MPIFAVAYQTTASTSIKVEAATAEEAVEKAEEEFGMPTLCHQCSSVELADWEPVEGEDGVWQVGD